MYAAFFVLYGGDRVADKVSNTPWGNFNNADFTPEQLCRSALMDFNPRGSEKTKEMCKLPVKEPNGTLNRNAIQAAAGGRGITRVKQPSGVSSQEFAAQRRKAANRIIGLYRRALGRPAPASVFRIAGKKQPQRSE